MTGCQPALLLYLKKETKAYMQTTCVHDLCHYKTNGTDNSHLDEHQIFACYQHGFRQKHTTVTNDHRSMQWLTNDSRGRLNIMTYIIRSDKMWFTNRKRKVDVDGKISAIIHVDSQYHRAL